MHTGELGFKTGVGFHEWSEEEIRGVQERLLHHLLSALQSKQKN
jgi:hypothetical protein